MLIKFGKVLTGVGLVAVLVSVASGFGYSTCPRVKKKFLKRRSPVYACLTVACFAIVLLIDCNHEDA